MCISETFVQTNEVKRPGCHEMVMLARLNLLQLQQFVRLLTFIQLATWNVMCITA